MLNGLRNVQRLCIGRGKQLRNTSGRHFEWQKLRDLGEKANEFEGWERAAVRWAVHGGTRKRMAFPSTGFRPTLNEDECGLWPGT